MKYGKVIIYTIIIMFFYSTVSEVVASEKDIIFNRLTAEDGLSQATINYIFQDSDGYMWFATEDGLNRYDGNEFEIYNYGSNSEKSLSYNWVTTINEDNEGNIWFGTLSGINKINKNTKEIDIYTEARGNIENDEINDIYIDSKGEVIVSTEKGISIYNEELDSFEYIGFVNLIEYFNNKSVYKIVQDSDEVYWIATEEGISSYNKITNKVENHKFKEGEDNKSNITDIYIDTKDRLWVSTFGDGISIINTETNDVRFLNENSDDDISIPSNYVEAVIEDKDGVIWIGTDSGIALYDEIDDKINTYISKSHDSTTLIDNDILSIFQCRSGMIWVGSSKGINTFNPNSIFNVYKNDPFDENTINNNIISGIYQDEDEFIWVGTSGGGVNIIDRENDTVYRLNEEIKNNNIFESDFITSISGVEDEIWISTKEQVILLNKETREVRNFFNGYNQEIKTLYIDEGKEVWVGTVQGLYKIDRSYKIIDYSSIFNRFNIDMANVTTIFKDSEKFIWIGLGGSNGLLKYNEEEDTIIKYTSSENDENTLSYNFVKDIAEDLNGDIWIATRDGLNKYNKEKDNFTRLTDLDGLADNLVYGILVDYENNLWLSTNNGISRYDQESKSFINFKVEDGLQSNEFNYNSHFKSCNEEMFFGGVSGLNSFYPDKFEQTSIEAKLIIDNIKVAGENINSVKNIVLEYYEDTIEIEMFLADYRNSNNTVYAYMLQGIDEDWQYEYDKRSITYKELEAGKYTLLVSAQNSYGRWSEVIKIDIEKKEEPWRTKFAYLMYFLVIIIFIVYIKIKGKAVDLIVNKKTYELNNKLVENTIMYKKSIDNEINKNNYFVNLSHELRTPLNVILATESLIEALNKKESHIEKDKLDYYMNILRKNSNRLLKLINNIIDTSKIESGTYELIIKESDIVYHIEDIALSMKDYIEEKGIKFIIDPLIEEKVIECDINEIEKCVINLISNAIKFTKSGGEIQVIIEEELDFVNIIVKDSGVGINPEDLNKIFERFGQAKNRDSAIIKGSGIGLFLTKQIVELHNGELIVKSKVGEGSEFIISLPVKHIPKVSNLVEEKIK